MLPSRRSTHDKLVAPLSEKTYKLMWDRDENQFIPEENQDRELFARQRAQFIAQRKHEQQETDEYIWNLFLQKGKQNLLRCLLQGSALPGDAFLCCALKCPVRLDDECRENLLARGSGDILKLRCFGGNSHFEFASLIPQLLQVPQEPSLDLGAHLLEIAGVGLKHPFFPDREIHWHVHFGDIARLRLKIVFDGDAAKPHELDYKPGKFSMEAEFEQIV